MNAKYALALILILQVSMSLGDIPTPSKELNDKYNALKEQFYKRLLNVYSKAQAAASPMIESTTDGQAAKNFLASLGDNSQLQAAAKIGAGIGEQAVPLLDKARSAGLGAYEEYLRPYISTYLENGINNIKFFLDIFMPAE